MWYSKFAGKTDLKINWSVKTPLHGHKEVALSGVLAPDTSKKNINEPKKAPAQKQEIIIFTWACDIMTGSLKTVQVTASLQVGVVREPGYRKYLVLFIGRRFISGKAAKIFLSSVDRKTNYDYWQSNNVQDTVKPRRFLYKWYLKQI